MVLEHLVPEKWIEKKFLFALLLGFVFSVVSIFAATNIFGRSSGIVSVIFLSILLLPTMRKLFLLEEKQEEHEKKFSLIHLFKDNKHLFEAYFGVFIGVFLAYFLSTFLLPQWGINTFGMFKEQLFNDTTAVKGLATYDSSLFISILANNWLVLVVTFLLSLLAGDGALFFVAWNASLWGAVFGYRVLTASIYDGTNPWLTAIILFLIVGWHIILEGGAYILAAISGAVISDDVIKKSTEMKRFIGYGVLVFAGYFFFSWIINMFFTNMFILVFSKILVLFGLMHMLGAAFTNRQHGEVYTYNYYLFIIAIIVFILGALIETFVLGNSTFLNELYRSSYLFTIGLV